LPPRALIGRLKECLALRGGEADHRQVSWNCGCWRGLSHCRPSGQTQRGMRRFPATARVCRDTHHCCAGTYRPGTRRVRTGAPGAGPGTRPSALLLRQRPRRRPAPTADANTIRPGDGVPPCPSHRVVGRRCLGEVGAGRGVRKAQRAASASLTGQRPRRSPSRSSTPRRTWMRAPEN
jgi:hypothetical protein